VVTFSLDTSAVLRFVDQEAGVDRLEEIFDQRDRGIARVIMCAVHWAEAFGLELAYNISDHILVTADFDVKLAAQDIAIEFLPIKPKT
jgi:hypothetical protein